MISRTLWHKGTKGQAMVEAAFVLFILIVLTFGMTEFGRAMYTKNTLTNASRAGARQAVVTPSLPIPSGYVNLQTDCTQYGTTGDDPVYQAVCNSLVTGIDKTQVAVSISNANPNNPALPNDPVTVSVRYSNFASVLPNLFGQGPGKIPFPNTLTAATTMRYE